MTNLGRVMTVKGRVEAGLLGPTLVHEHLIADIRSLMCPPFDESRTELRDRTIDEVDRALLVRDPLVSRDNCLLNDETAAVQEVELFRAIGGGTIVECSSTGLGRDVRALQRIAASTSVNIVAPTGFYLWHSVDESFLAMSVDDLAGAMIGDITTGIDGTEIKAGVIGEIGTSGPLHEFEIRVLRASAVAHAETGVPISIHLDQSSREAVRVIELLIDGGVDPARVVIGHLDQRADMDRSYIHHIASAGVFLGLDTFGTEFDYDSIGMSDPTDTQRIKLFKDLVESGLGHQIVLSHDVGLKCMLRRYGGGGYAHILRELLPVMASVGIPDHVVSQCLVDNPARWLSGDSRA